MPFQVGDPVILHRLVGRPELNYETGLVIEALGPTGRVGIRLTDSGERVAVKPSNLMSDAPEPVRPAPAPVADDSAAGRVLHGADTFAHIAEFVRGWSSDAFADVDRMRRVCSSWRLALRHVSRRVELPPCRRYQATVKLDETKLLLIDERLATVLDVTDAAPCAVIEHDGALCVEYADNLVAIGPSSFVKAHQLTHDGQSKRAAWLATNATPRHADTVELLVYSTSPGATPLSRSRVALTQTCSLPTGRACNIACRVVAGSRLLVSFADVLTVWRIDATRTRLELSAQLVGPGCRPLSAPELPSRYGDSEASIWAIEALDDDTVAVCHGDGGQDSQAQQRSVHVWSLRRELCVSVMPVLDVEACAVIPTDASSRSTVAAAIAAAAISRTGVTTAAGAAAAADSAAALAGTVTVATVTDGWPACPAADPPPAASAHVASGAALLLYEERAGFTFELGVYDLRLGTYRRSGCSLPDVVRSMAALQKGLVAVAADDGHVRLFCVQRRAFVPWPGATLPEDPSTERRPDVTKVTSMAGGSALVVESVLPAFNVAWNDRTRVVLWVR